MKFRIENFKLFSGEAFEFPKITVLIGENSGGKSSLLKLFLFLKQCMHQNSTRYNHKLSGPYHDFGTYKDVVRNHKITSKIKLDFEFSFDEAIPELSKYFTSDEDSSKPMKEFEEICELHKNSKISVSIQLPADKNDHSKISNRIEWEGAGHLEIFGDPEQNNPDGDFTKDPKMFISGVISNQKFTRLEVTGRKNGFFSNVNPTSIQDKFDLTAFLKLGVLILSQRYLDLVFSRTAFINPLFARPDRFIDLRENASRTSSSEIENVASNIVGKIYGKSLEEKLNNAVVSMGLADSINLKRNQNNPFAEFRIIIDGVENNIMDVGYGIGLQVAVISNIIQSNLNGRFVLLEQPEVHLHPRMQSKFIETIFSDEINANFIIETHSEHILKKLQIMVKSGKYKFTSDDIAIYYFSRTNGKSITKHVIDENGNIFPPFPPGFYDSGFELTKELYNVG